MATKKKTAKKSNKPKTVNIRLTLDEANKLYDFVNVTEILYDGTVSLMDEGNANVLAGSDADHILFDKLTAKGVTGYRSHLLGRVL